MSFKRIRLFKRRSRRFNRRSRWVFCDDLLRLPEQVNHLMGLKRIKFSTRTVCFSKNPFTSPRESFNGYRDSFTSLVDALAGRKTRLPDLKALLQYPAKGGFYAQRSYAVCFFVDVIANACFIRKLLQSFGKSCASEKINSSVIMATEAFFACIYDNKII